MFGYVITSNTVDDGKGFFAPFPRFVVKLSDLYYKHVSFLDRKGNMRHHWDYWSYREEMQHRRFTAAAEQFTSHPDYMTF